MPAKMSNRGRIVGVVIAVVVRVGFMVYRDNQAAKRLYHPYQEAQLEEEKFQQAKKEALDLDKEQARAELVSQPSRLLFGGTASVVFRRETFTTYSRVTAVMVANISSFDVAEVAGDLTYISDSGKEMATVPFRSEGGIGAGQTTKLKITATEVRGNAQQGHIVVRTVRIVDK